MTQNDVVDKTDTFGTPSAGRREFLNALYTGSPDNLYLELRCIHPTTGEARSLWGRMGNKTELAATFKQAETLNREGFGVYFAPCLRKGKQGKAEAAALVPALWVDIDCEGDAYQRDQNLMKLRDFDPALAELLDELGQALLTLRREPGAVEPDQVVVALVLGAGAERVDQLVLRQRGGDEARDRPATAVAAGERGVHPLLLPHPGRRTSARGRRRHSS